MLVLLNKMWGRTIAVTLWPFIFIRRDSCTHVTLNHEFIHIDQQKELLLVFGILWYVVEYLLKSLYYRSFEKGYVSVSFEREAYANEHDLDYRDKRKHYAFLKYVIVRNR